MPAPIIGAVALGLRSLIARAAVGGVAEVAAGKATQTAGSKLLAGFLDSKVAKGAVRVYRGVQETGIASEFAVPPAGVPGLKTYQSSRAAAEAMAGAKGQVFRIDLPKASMASYSPSPISGSAGGTQFNVPFTEHAANARQVIANPLGGASVGSSGGPGGGFSGFKNFIQSKIGNGFSGFSNSPTSAGGSGNRSISRIVNSARNFIQGNGFSGFSSRQGTGGGQSAGRSTASDMYQGIQNLASWRPTTPPGPANVQPYNGGGPSFPSINPSDLMGMAGKSRDDIAQTNANNASQQAFDATRAKNLRDLDEQVKRAKESFKGIAEQTIKYGLLLGSGVAPYIVGKGITQYNSSTVDNDLETHGQYNAAFAEMKLRRQFQDIQLSRTTARETNNSEKFLNDQNMKGKEQLSEISNDLKTIMNFSQGVAQMAGNGLLKLAELTSLGQALKGVADLIERGLATDKTEIDRDQIANLIAKSVDVQNQTRDEKRMKPLKPVR